MAFPTLSRRMLLAAGAASLSLAVAVPAQAEDTVKLGLVAAMSGQSAKSGEASTASLVLAENSLDLCQVCRLREGKHQQDARVERRQALDSNSH